MLWRGWVVGVLIGGIGLLVCLLLLSCLVGLPHRLVVACSLGGRCSLTTCFDVLCLKGSGGCDPACLCCLV